MKNLLRFVLIVVCASAVSGDTRPVITRGSFDSAYLNTTGDTLTGKLRFINGSAASPSADSAAGAGFHFTASAFAIDVGGTTTTICGVGCASGSGGTYGWSSTADATGTADLKLTRVGAKQLGWAGSTAGAVTHDFSSLTATRVVTWPDAAFTVVGRDTTDTLTNKTLTTPSINDLRGVSRVTGVGTLAPTVTGTGFGASPTYTVLTGSSDAFGSVNIVPGGAGIATSGTLTITFSAATAYGSNGVSCVAMLGNGAASWNARATLIAGTFSTTSAAFAWDNNAVAPSSGSGIRVHWFCGGK